MNDSRTADSREFLNSTEAYRIQKTVKSSLSFSGVGLHTGVKTKIRLVPAPPNHGIVFVRINDKGSHTFPAHFHSVVSTTMATSLGIKGKPESCIHTVEHLMASLMALGITNLLIEVEGPEIPILDGSANPFFEAVMDSGIEFQPYSAATLRVLKPIKIYHDGTVCELLPRKNLRLTTSIDFPHPAIGSQVFALELTPGSFRDQVAKARTFGFFSEVEKLRAKNLALGASLENVLAFDDMGVVNPDGARFTDECVRHKLLDAIGDLALCGSWIQGELVSFRGGHSIHLRLLQMLKEVPGHWELLAGESLKPQPQSNVIPMYLRRSPT